MTTLAGRPLEQYVPWVPVAAVVLGFVSIGASHTLIAISLLAVVAAYGRKFRFPPLWIPLASFVALTVASDLVSGDAAEGWPQIRKFYVWLLAPLVYTAVRSVAMLHRMLTGMALAALASAVYSLVQFAIKWQRAPGAAFYQSYVADRITGFMSHWMTFSGEMMIALMVVGAAVAFIRLSRARAALWVAAGFVIGIAIVLAFTRSVWPGAALGLVYLMWNWKRWTVLLVPLAAVAVVLLAPAPVQTRIQSMFRPNQKLDSNAHREFLRETGYRMIAARPLLGFGPEQVDDHFLEYVPPSAPRPWPEAWYYKHLHNNYVHYAAERGLPALAALLWLFGKILWDLMTALRRLEAGERRRRFILHAAVASVIAVLTAGWWEVNLGDSEVLGAVVALAAAGYVAAEVPEQEEAA